MAQGMPKHYKIQTEAKQQEKIKQNKGENKNQHTPTKKLLLPKPQQPLRKKVETETHHQQETQQNHFTKTHGRRPELTRHA
jgi:hypothetical protein